MLPKRKVKKAITKLPAYFHPLIKAYME